MAESFNLRILAADKPFYEGKCIALDIPTLDGQRQILAHHCNMIAAIVPGVMKGTFTEEESQTAAVSGGIIKVEDNDVLVLVDTAERPEEIDENRAKRAEAEAKEELLQKKSIQEYKEAQATLARAINRLRVKQNYSNHR